MPHESELIAADDYFKGNCVKCKCTVNWMKQRTATKQLQVGLEVCWRSFVWVIPAPYMVNIFCDLVLVHLLQTNNFLSYLLNFSCFCFLFQTCSEVIFLFYYFFIFLPQNSILFQELSCQFLSFALLFFSLFLCICFVVFTFPVKSQFSVAALTTADTGHKSPSVRKEVV